jgi:hypothetical protein
MSLNGQPLSNILAGLHAGSNLAAAERPNDLFEYVPIIDAIPTRTQQHSFCCAFVSASILPLYARSDDPQLMYIHPYLSFSCGAVCKLALLLCMTAMAIGDHYAALIMFSCLVV